MAHPKDTMSIVATMMAFMIGCLEIQTYRKRIERRVIVYVTFELAMMIVMIVMIVSIFAIRIDRMIAASDY